jgi:hypothetical protein
MSGKPVHVRWPETRLNNPAAVCALSAVDPARHLAVQLANLQINSGKPQMGTFQKTPKSPVSVLPLLREFLYPPDVDLQFHCPPGAERLSSPFRKYGNV